MGMFDEIVDGKKYTQVKCWDRQFDRYHIGDKVPDLYRGTYSIELSHQGGYVNIKDGILESWTDSPKAEIIVDRLGRPVTVRPKGILEDVPPD